MNSESKHLVLGAGFSGPGVMAAFSRAAIPFDAVEAEEDLGGNWRHGGRPAARGRDPCVT